MRCRGIQHHCRPECRSNSGRKVWIIFNAITSVTFNRIWTLCWHCWHSGPALSVGKKKTWSLGWNAPFYWNGTMLSVVPQLSVLTCCWDTPVCHPEEWVLHYLLDRSGLHMALVERGKFGWDFNLTSKSTDKQPRQRCWNDAGKYRDPNLKTVN